MIPEKPKPNRLGLILMIAGFMILALAAAMMIFQSRGTYQFGDTGRHLLIVGLGTYLLGRLFLWRGRRIK